MGDLTGGVLVLVVPSYKVHGHQKTVPENSAMHFGTIDRRSSECYKVNALK